MQTARQQGAFDHSCYTLRQVIELEVRKRRQQEEAQHPLLDQRGGLLH
jgi:hypothetical protein